MSHPIYKQDINKLYNNITAYLPNPNKSPPQNFLYHRTTKSNIKRPYSVNKTYSEFKNKSKSIYIQTKIAKQIPKAISNYGYLLFKKTSKSPHQGIASQEENYIGEIHLNSRINKKCKLNS